MSPGKFLHRTLTLSSSLIYQSSLLYGPPIRWRQLSSAASKIFDPHTKAKQKARASIAPDVQKYDYLRDHIATQLVDRLYDIPRTFPTGLDLFCGSGHILRALRAKQLEEGGEGEGTTEKITKLLQADIHEVILKRAASENVVDNEENMFVYKEDDNLMTHNNDKQYDAVLSSGGLHWISDLPSVLYTIRKSLVSDGVFLGAMLGGSTLQELRISMQLAEDQLCERIAPRISPMVHLRDVANLLSVAGFTMPTADYERITITFKDMYTLMSHLRGMGETNALYAREIHYGRKTFERAAEIYMERFGQSNSDGNSSIPATIEIMYMIGWAPSSSQPVARERGSASVSFTELSNLPKASEQVGTNSSKTRLT